MNIGVSGGFTSGAFLENQTALFARYGYKPAFQTFTGTALAVPALESGSIDTFENGPPPAAVLGKSYPNLRFLGPVGYNSFSLDVAKRSPIRSLKGLVGKKVAVFSQASQQWLLINALMKKEGIALRLDPVRLFRAPASMQNLLTSGQVAAIAVWPPYGTEGNRTGQDRTLLSAGQMYQSLGIGGHFLADGLFTTSSYIKTNPNAIRALIAAGDAYIKAATTKSSEVASTWAKSGGASLAAAKYVIQNHYFSFPTSMKPDPTSMADMWKLYQMAGVVTGSQVPSYVRQMATYTVPK